MRKFWEWMILTIAVILLLSAASASATVEQEEEWKNILLLGGDSRGSETYERSDAMIILSINRQESLVKLTSIMRDTWVNFPGMNVSNKINAASVYGGPELSMATVNACFGTDIEDYVIINMQNMVHIVDLLGGIDLELSGQEAANVGTNSGLVHLDGAQTLAYCRIRKIDSDYRRVMRQQKALLALARRAQEMEVNELTDCCEEISDIILTNMDDDELKDLMMALLVMDVEEVEQYRIPADGTFDSGMFGGTWMIRPNFDENASLLREFIYGK